MDNWQLDQWKKKTTYQNLGEQWETLEFGGTNGEIPRECPDRGIPVVTKDMTCPSGTIGDGIHSAAFNTE